MYKPFTLVKKHNFHPIHHNIEIEMVNFIQLRIMSGFGFVWK